MEPLQKWMKHWKWNFTLDHGLAPFRQLLKGRNNLKGKSHFRFLKKIESVPFEDLGSKCVKQPISSVKRNPGKRAWLLRTELWFLCLFKMEWSIERQGFMGEKGHLKRQCKDMERDVSFGSRTSGLRRVHPKILPGFEVPPLHCEASNTIEWRNWTEACRKRTKKIVPTSLFYVFLVRLKQCLQLETVFYLR